MCKGFGMIITKEIKGYFIDPDDDGDISHSEILYRLGWKENKKQFIRNFVRIECNDWTMNTFMFDERDTLPGWTEDHIDEIISLVGRTLESCAPIWFEFNRVHAPALKKYEGAQATAIEEFENKCSLSLDNFNKIVDLARDELYKICAQALVEYRKTNPWIEYNKTHTTQVDCIHDEALLKYEYTCAVAMNEYEKVRTPAWAEHQKVRAPAWAEYENVHNAAADEYTSICGAAREKMISAMRRIPGYVAS